MEVTFLCAQTLSYERYETKHRKYQQNTIFLTFYILKFVPPHSNLSEWIDIEKVVDGSAILIRSNALVWEICDKLFLLIFVSFVSPSIWVQLSSSCAYLMYLDEIYQFHVFTAPKRLFLLTFLLFLLIFSLFLLSNTYIFEHS